MRALLIHVAMAVSVISLPTLRADGGFAISGVTVATHGSLAVAADSVTEADDAVEDPTSKFDVDEILQQPSPATSQGSSGTPKPATVFPLQAPKGMEPFYQAAIQKKLEHEVWELRHREAIYEWQHTAGQIVFWAAVIVLATGIYMSFLQFQKEYVAPDSTGRSDATGDGQLNGAMAVISDDAEEADEAGEVSEIKQAVGDEQVAVRSESADCKGNELGVVNTPSEVDQESAKFEDSADNSDELKTGTAAVPGSAVVQSAVIGGTASQGNHEVSVSPTSATVKTSMVGVVILTLSLAFFFLYLHLVFPIV